MLGDVLYSCELLLDLQTASTKVVHYLAIGTDTVSSLLWYRNGLSLKHIINSVWKCKILAFGIIPVIYSHYFSKHYF